MSKGTNWTAGPWRRLPYQHGDGASLSLRIVGDDGPYTGDSVAEVRDGAGDYAAKAEANANLIAAAPELYTANEDAEFLLRMLAEHPEDLASMMDSIKRCADDLRAALAKARGEDAV